MILNLILVAALAAVPADTVRPVADSTPPEPALSASRALLPFAFYTPETKLGGGAMAGYYRRLAPGLPVSSALLAITVTARGQYAADLLPEAYLRGGRRFDGSLRVHHYPDSYFGIGPGTPDDGAGHYTSRKVAVRVRAQWRARDGVSVGPIGSYRWEDVLNAEDVLDAEDGAQLTAADGGRWTGIGGLITLDTRDAVLSPRRGVYTQVSATTHPEFLGSTGTYHRGALDARLYASRAEGPVLAVRALVDVSAGEVPVLDLPALGGSDRLRGYLQGRYRDRCAASLQAELRTPIHGRLGAAVFAEAGQVADTPGSLGLSSPEASAGVGARWRLGQEGAPIRLDFARGRRGTGLYITVGEAF